MCVVAAVAVGAAFLVEDTEGCETDNLESQTGYHSEEGREMVQRPESASAPPWKVGQAVALVVAMYPRRGDQHCHCFHHRQWFRIQSTATQCLGRSIPAEVGILVGVAAPVQARSN